MAINNVVDFVTYKKRLEDAEASMQLAYLDYKDNTGNDDVDWFWNDFEKKREIWRAIRDEVKEGKEDGK